MCGIIGGYDRDRRPFGDEMADAACRRIAHRGPDDQGIYEADGMLIGNRRLSILDVAGGHQPMFSDDGQIAVVQNGEIYNFVELSKNVECRTTCDTEVILRLYERDGEDFIRQLNGMFAIAILDRRRGCLLLYRDRLGKKPLYIHDDGKRLRFGSEIKSLIPMGLRPELDWTALDAYLTFNFVPPPLTLFRGVRHLLPGHMLRIDASGVSERAYWRIESEPEERSESEWQDQILDTLRDSVRIRLRSDVPLGAFLSGGIDSSLIVKLMSELRPKDIPTFCIGLDDASNEDWRYAQKAAQYCGTNHHCEIVQPDIAASWPLSVYFNDQPHGDVSFLPTYWVSRMARRHVKVALTGDGADELFGGYGVHLRLMAECQALFSNRPAFERACYQAINIFSEQERQSLYCDQTRRLIGGADAFALAEPHFAQFRHQDPLNQMLGLDVGLLLPGNNLVKPDKMAMAVGLETRSPFLDYRLVELAFRIPGHLKIRSGESKSILKTTAARVLPRDIIYRPKQTFTLPVAEWFRGPLLPLLNETLLSSRSVSRGLFEPRTIRALLEEHSSGRRNLSRQIRTLLALEFWQRIFIDQSLDHAPTLQEIGLSLTNQSAYSPVAA